MKLTRRFFLQSSGALFAYCGAAPLKALGDAVASGTAAEVARGRTIVVVFLRGGIDGLNFVVPYGDPAYADLRPSLKVARPGKDGGGHDLDGFFALHPRAESLMHWHRKGLLAAAHAVGYDHNTRSHFEEQDRWETGIIGNTVSSDGWLNRHLLTSEGHGPVRAIALGGNLPRILRGDAPAYAIRGLDDLGLPGGKGGPTEQARVAAALEHAYQCDPQAVRPQALDLLSQTAGSTLEGIELIGGVTASPYEPAASYPDTGLARQLAQAARLIKANVGLEVIEIDYGGWDTHENQGGGPGGNFGDKVATLADAAAAFAQDLGDKLHDVLLLTLSDFGRAARENGNRGTDHGWGNCMLALGGPVAHAGNHDARPVVGTWPGLGPDQLHQKRDLLHTTDFRDVLAEVVRVHLGNPNLQRVLPNHTFKPVGLV